MPTDRREAFYHDRLQKAGQHYVDFDLPSAEVVLSLFYTCDVLQQLTSRYMNEVGLSRSTLNILAILRHGPEGGMQLHDLGELLLVSRANVTGLIDHLEAKELVTRVVDANDRRARLARITKKGKALLDEFMPTHYRNVKLLLSALTAEQKETLSHLLKTVRASLANNANAILLAGTNSY